MIKWNNLQNLLKEYGVKKKLSESANISTGNISDWFNPHKKAQPSAEALFKIAEFFNCSVDYLLDRTNIKEVPKQYSDNIIHLIDMGEIISIDTYMYPVSAGKGNVYTDEQPISKLYPATSISSKADYCVRISGDSMYPQYLNGDIVYVEECIPKHNDIGIFLYNGEAYCKKYYEKRGVKKLISLNPNQDKYTPIIIENESFVAQGVVIGKFHAD